MEKLFKLTALWSVTRLLAETMTAFVSVQEALGKADLANSALAVNKVDGLFPEPTTTVPFCAWDAAHARKMCSLGVLQRLPLAAGEVEAVPPGAVPGSWRDAPHVSHAGTGSEWGERASGKDLHSVAVQ